MCFIFIWCVESFFYFARVTICFVNWYNMKLYWCSWISPPLWMHCLIWMPVIVDNHTTKQCYHCASRYSRAAGARVCPCQPPLFDRPVCRQVFSYGTPGVAVLTVRRGPAVQEGGLQKGGCRNVVLGSSGSDWIERWPGPASSLPRVVGVPWWRVSSIREGRVSASV